MTKRRKTKAERQRWWKNLSPQEQEAYIERRQARKTAWRKKHPKKELAYDRRFPWATEGVDDTNRAAWQRMILKKNPWLRSTVFGQAEAGNNRKSG